MATDEETAFNTGSALSFRQLPECEKLSDVDISIGEKSQSVTSRVSLVYNDSSCMLTADQETFTVDKETKITQQITALPKPNSNLLPDFFSCMAKMSLRDVSLKSQPDDVGGLKHEYCF